MRHLRDRQRGLTRPRPRDGGAYSSPGALKSREDLEALFSGEGVDLDQPIVTPCGSGVSAAIIALALARLGRWDAPVYDGSWTEWASRPDAEIATVV